MSNHERSYIVKSDGRIITEQSADTIDRQIVLKAISPENLKSIIYADSSYNYANLYALVLKTDLDLVAEGLEGLMRMAAEAGWSPINDEININFIKSETIPPRVKDIYSWNSNLNEPFLGVSVREEPRKTIRGDTYTTATATIWAVVSLQIREQIRHDFENKFAASVEQIISDHITHRNPAESLDISPILLVKETLGLLGQNLVEYQQHEEYPWLADIAVQQMVRVLPRYPGYEYITAQVGKMRENAHSGLITVRPRLRPYFPPVYWQPQELHVEVPPNSKAFFEPFPAP